MAGTPNNIAMNHFRTLSAHFDADLATKHVQKWIEARACVPEAHAESLIRAQPDRLTIIQEPPFYCYRAVHSGTDEEAVFRMQGVLVSASTPPFQTERPDTISLKTLRFTYQHAGIIGFGSKLFEAQRRKLDAIHWQYSDSSSRINMIPWVPPVFENNTELVAKCRLFTTGKDATYSVPAPLPSNVDPDGLMARICRRPDVEFTHENNVSFKKMEVDKNDQSRTYVDVSPDIFRPGDIVEVEFTTLGFPNGDGDKGTAYFIVLSGLTLLDNELSKATRLLELDLARRQTERVPTKTAIKRKVGYDRDESGVEENRKKRAGLCWLTEAMATMSVDSKGADA